MIVLVMTDGDGSTHFNEDKAFLQTITILALHHPDFYHPAGSHVLFAQA